MTVEGFHTYFVSGLGIWVHNDSCSILDWSITNKKGQTRWEHTETHTKPNMNRDTHGVFSQNPVSTLNQAWNKVQQNNLQPSGHRAGADIYRVPYPNAGRGGGRLDNGQTLNTMEIVVMEGTNKLLTGYPVR
ncbi:MULTISPECIES: hypothetical protein [Saccharibacillus]|uniref:hypothetical protein n=1 Tax=Saccharibacillus TaxID=456492 RepID=UPI001F31DF4B|nr:hypothetical protein [Saccharibacillus sp. WB 17]